MVRASHKRACALAAGVLAAASLPVQARPASATCMGQKFLWDGSSLTRLADSAAAPCAHWSIWYYQWGTSKRPGRQWSEDQAKTAAQALKLQQRADQADMRRSHSRGASYPPPKDGHQNYLGPICVSPKARKLVKTSGPSAWPDLPDDPPTDPQPGPIDDYDQLPASHEPAARPPAAPKAHPPKPKPRKPPPPRPIYSGAARTHLYGDVFTRQSVHVYPKYITLEQHFEVKDKGVQWTRERALLADVKASPPAPMRDDVDGTIYTVRLACSSCVHLVAGDPTNMSRAKAPGDAMWIEFKDKPSATTFFNVVTRTQR
jgi:hypothetical protein